MGPELDRRLWPAVIRAQNHECEVIAVATQTRQHVSCSLVCVNGNFCVVRNVATSKHHGRIYISVHFSAQFWECAAGIFSVREGARPDFYVIPVNVFAYWRNQLHATMPFPGKESNEPENGGSAVHWPSYRDRWDLLSRQEVRGGA